MSNVRSCHEEDDGFCLISVVLGGGRRAGGWIYYPLSVKDRFLLWNQEVLPKQRRTLVGLLPEVRGPWLRRDVQTPQASRLTGFQTHGTGTGSGKRREAVLSPAGFPSHL